MSPKFFGQYLLEKGFITPQQLLLAVERQAAVNLKLGERAVRQGWMGPAQIVQVLARQRSVDKLFGELCVEQKFLTQEQVGTLLARQQAEHLLFGVALVQLQALTPAALDRALTQYKTEHPPESSAPAGLSLRLPHGKEMREVAHLTCKLLHRVGGVLAKPGVANVMKGPLEPVELEVWTSFQGTFDCRFLLRMPKVLSMQLGLCFSGGAARSATEVVDSVLEFCNVVAGNYCAMLDGAGRACTVVPPQASVEGRAPVVPSGAYALFPFYTTFGELQVVFEPTAR